MNFTLKQLRYVEAAGRLGSIAAAAADLSISQSSITAAIDALESGLGHDIFIRTPAKGIQPTPTGIETLQLIRAFIDQARQFEAEVTSIGGATTGLVRIACYATAAPAFLPPILKAITDRFPDISIRVLEGNMATIMDFLNDGEADLAFTYNQVLDGRHGFEPLFAAPPFALIPTDDPLAHQKDISFRQLAKKPMILLDLPHTKEYFIGMFEAQGVYPNIVHSTRSSEIARALVSGGYGYTILNIRPLDYRENDSRYRVLPIRDVGKVQEFGIATTADTRQPKMVRAFIDICIQLKNQGVFDQLIVQRATEPFRQKIE